MPDATPSSLNIVEQIVERAAAQPDHPAIITSAESDEILSYRELAFRIQQRATAWIADGSLKAGDRCGLVAGQGAEFVEMALSIMATGACVVPIADDLSGKLLHDFTQRAFLHKVVLEREQFTCRAVDFPVDATGAPSEKEFRALDPAYLRFTSGTTNERKGVVLGHATIVERIDAANRALEITPEDNVLWLLPMAHHFVVSILLYLRAGATLLLPQSSLAREVLALANRHNATFVYASPYHYGLLAKDTSDESLPNIRLAISTAEGLRAETASLFDRRYGISLVQALGIIEVGLPVLNLDSRAAKPDALGKPLPDYRISFLDDNEEPLCTANSPEHTGEICIQGPGLFDAYLSPWIPARKITEPHGFRTGDQGWIDTDGDLRLVGRRANRINMAGMKFFGEEVEAILNRHPEIEASRVFGQEHPALGEIPVAEIVARDPARKPDRRELLPFCKAQLPAYKIPRKFIVVEQLAQTATGKIQRRPSSSGHS